MNALHIRIHGSVQGVWFRQSTVEAVQKIGGITGYVKNEPDGTVFIHVEGEETKLKKFISWCQKGAPLSRVDQVQTQKVEEKGFENFQIRFR